MPIVSKYNNEQFDALMNDLITALESLSDDLVVDIDEAFSEQ